MPGEHSGRPADPGTTLGPLLARLRLTHGFSQLRVAEQLCAAAGVPTVTRHEVSRWEREERVPGSFWLGWLAMVFEVPVGELAAAAAVTRSRGAAAARPAGRHDPGAIGRLAHAWLAEPAGPPSGGRDDVRRLADQLAGLGARLAGGETPGGPVGGQLSVERLRRLDDLVGGVDLAAVVGRQVIATARRTVADAGRPARRLAHLADAAQLAGWVAADAGDPSGALAAYRLALLAATAAGDRPLGAHVIASASQLLLEAGQAGAALLLARTAYAGGFRTSSGTGRAVLAHRVAVAAALAGQRRAAERALAVAEDAAAGHLPARDPAWLYWAGPARLATMSGRCLAALGRPLRAAPLFRTGLAAAAGPRDAALSGAALARAYLDLGEVEQCCDVAGPALSDAIRSGSVRASVQVSAVTDRVAGFADLPCARGHLRLAAAARPFLPATRSARAARG